jgi:hypothetical protein
VPLDDRVVEARILLRVAQLRVLAAQTFVEITARELVAAPAVVPPLDRRRLGHLLREWPPRRRASP